MRRRRAERLPPGGNTSASTEGCLRAEPSTAVHTDDVPCTGRRRHSVVADLERAVDDTRTDSTGYLSVSVPAQVCAELNRVQVVLRPAVRRARLLPGVDLRPSGDDDGRVGLRVADDDDEQDTVVAGCEPPTVGRVPAELTGTYRLGDDRECDVSPALLKATPEVVGESVSAGVTDRCVPRRPSRVGRRRVIRPTRR